MADDIKFPSNENAIKVSVITESGIVHKAIATAVMDGEVQLPSNPNSISGYIIGPDGKKHRVILVAVLRGGTDANAYHFKGSVATYDDLPTTGLKEGDVYNVKDTGMNYGWTGTEWDALGMLVDLGPIEAEIEALQNSTSILQTQEALSSTIGQSTTIQLANLFAMENLDGRPSYKGKGAIVLSSSVVGIINSVTDTTADVITVSVSLATDLSNITDAGLIIAATASMPSSAVPEPITLGASGSQYTFDKPGWLSIIGEPTAAGQYIAVTCRQVPNVTYSVGAMRLQTFLPVAKGAPVGISWTIGNKPEAKFIPAGGKN